MSIKLWCCGGFAGNIGQYFYNVPPAQGFAKLDCCFLDTSLSNLREGNVNEKDIFIVEGADGSGSLRQSNSKAIMESIKTIVHKFQPEQFNIVLFSLSGGSGSVIGPLLIKELITKGKSVIAISLGSEESKIKIENTIKSLQTLDNLSRNVFNKPLVLSYHHNSKEVGRLKNDENVKQTITALSILCSGQNAELDTADITNFIEVDKVTTVKEGLVSLFVNSTKECDIEYPISIASLYSSREGYYDYGAPEYSCHGYPESGILKDKETNLHFITTQSEIKPLINKLTKRQEEFLESSSARVTVEALGGKADDSGMVW